jgi:hypothetical protein
MPHLHLPADHSDADLVLAANLAAVVGSEDLYVAWTHDTGPGAIPEVEAVVREDRPNIFVSVLAALAAGVIAVWRGLTHAPAAAAMPTPAPQPQARETSS